MNFTLRQLQIFSLFSRTLSVSETAKLVNVSQSAISHSLRELESEFGTKLFFRDGNNLKLTAEGRSFLPAVEGVFMQIDNLKSQASQTRDLQSGELSVAAISSIGNWLIHDAICLFIKDRPDMRFRFNRYSSNTVVEQVRNNAADIGFTMAANDDSGVTMTPLLKSEIVCVLPQNHALAAKSTVSLEDLQQERVITPGPHTMVGRLLLGTLPGGSHEMNGRHLEINQTSTIFSLVQAGVGVSLLHPFHTASRMEGTVLRRFAPGIELSVVMVYPRGKPISRAAQLFSNLVYDAARSHVKSRLDTLVQLAVHNRRAQRDY